MTDIKQMIYAMLTESTGVALCDSGGIYGRHWERNQKKSLADFERDPSATVDHDYDNSVSVSTFHLLTGAAGLELDDMCREYNEKYVPAKDWESDIYGVSKEAAEWLKRNSFEIEDSFNTYNGEWLGDQTLQGTYLKRGVDKYVLLQVHGGCDVRGGYTDARLFYLPEDWMRDPQVSAELADADGNILAQLDTMYNGWSLTDEHGASIEDICKTAGKDPNTCKVINAELNEY